MMRRRLIATLALVVALSPLAVTHANAKAAAGACPNITWQKVSTGSLPGSTAPAGTDKNGDTYVCYKAPVPPTLDCELVDYFPFFICTPEPGSPAQWTDNK